MFTSLTMPAGRGIPVSRLGSWLAHVKLDTRPLSIGAGDRDWEHREIFLLTLNTMGGKW